MSGIGEGSCDASTRPSTPPPDFTTKGMSEKEEKPEDVTVPQEIKELAKTPELLPSDLTIKYHTQVSRFEVLKGLEKELPKCAPNITIEEVKVYSAQVDELHQAFLSEHAYLESKWPASFIEHDYFVSNLFRREAQCSTKLKLKLSRIKEELETYNSVQTTTNQSLPPNLPTLTVPSFSGDFSQWAAFSERFAELVNKDVQLSDSDRLQYLRSSVKGDPIQLAVDLTAENLTFSSAWDLLTKRFLNRRALIKTQLDKLHDHSLLTSSSAKSLRELLATAKETKLTLSSLCKTASLEDCQLVHQVGRKLDKETREAWESTLEHSPDYPSWESLEGFIKGRAHALEKGKRVSSPSTPSTSTEHKEETTLTHQAASMKSFQCDCCEASHFVVMYPKFRQLSIPDRRTLITAKMLCRNCCGRHTTANCKSPLRCKHCKAAHHTMLHLAAKKSPSQATASIQRKE